VLSKKLIMELYLTGASPERVALIVDGNTARKLQRKMKHTEDGKLTIHMEPYGGFAGSWEQHGLPSPSGMFYH